MKRYRYNCVNCGDKLEELEFILENSDEISSDQKESYEEFTKNVNQQDLEQLCKELGYGENIDLSEDWHVEFRKSQTQKGKEVYFLVHSCIEHVFY